MRGKHPSVIASELTTPFPTQQQAISYQLKVRFPTTSHVTQSSPEHQAGRGPESESVEIQNYSFFCPFQGRHQGPHSKSSLTCSNDRRRKPRGHLVILDEALVPGLAGMTVTLPPFPHSSSGNTQPASPQPFTVSAKCPTHPTGTFHPIMSPCDFPG